MLIKLFGTIHVLGNLPGLTLTERAKERFTAEFLDSYAQTYPAKRIGTPEDKRRLYPSF
ncbi:hypothetical protein ACFOU2_22440 [Bacillus songklensis]|uniref:Uncharacterized protein n=1 Tax=Bacillus songklensis TaxID=1069116 RepID=A0ABV8B7D1_9BACI